MGKYSKVGILRIISPTFLMFVPKAVHGSFPKDTFEVINDIRRLIMKVKKFYGVFKPQKIRRNFGPFKLKS